MKSNHGTLVTECLLIILLLDQQIVTEENINTPRIHNNNVPCCLYKQTLMAFIHSVTHYYTDLPCRCAGPKALKIIEYQLPSTSTW